MTVGCPEKIVCVLLAFCASPLPSACAQQMQCDDDTVISAQHRAPRSLIETSVPQERRACVRQTTGYVVNPCWLPAIATPDSNLLRWHWSPTISFTQGGPTEPTGKGAAEAPRIVPTTGSHYLKYEHVPSPVVSQRSLAPDKPAAERDPSEAASPTHNANVSGKISTYSVAGREARSYRTQTFQHAVTEVHAALRSR